MKETMLMIAIVGIITGFGLLAIMLLRQPKTDVLLKNILDGTGGDQSIKRTSPTDRLKTTGFYKKRAEHLQKMIDLTYDEERTPETVYQWQMTWALLAFLAVPFLQLIFEFIPLSIGLLVFCIFMATSPDRDLNAKYKQKCDEFDKGLPTFLTNMSLAMDSGCQLEDAMRMAIQTLDSTMLIEFQQLLIDITVYIDDKSVAFQKLMQRVTSKDCERFCNVIISGLKNGNRMEDIIKNESENMNRNQIIKIRENGEKKKNSAEAVSLAMTFFPMIVIFIAPLMETAL